MKSIVLNNEEYTLFHAIIPEAKVDHKGNNVHLIYFADSDDLKVICNKLSDYFIEYGLLDNDEPNKLGLKIEELIDKFNFY